MAPSKLEILYEQRKRIRAGLHVANHALSLSVPSMKSKLSGFVFRFKEVFPEVSNGVQISEYTQAVLGRMVNGEWSTVKRLLDPIAGKCYFGANGESSIHVSSLKTVGRTETLFITGDANTIRKQIRQTVVRNEQNLFVHQEMPVIQHALRNVQVVDSKQLACLSINNRDQSTHIFSKVKVDEKASIIILKTTYGEKIQPVVWPVSVLGINIPTKEYIHTLYPVNQVTSQKMAEKAEHRYEKTTTVGFPLPANAVERKEYRYEEIMTADRMIDRASEEQTIKPEEAVLWKVDRAMNDMTSGIASSAQPAQNVSIYIDAFNKGGINVSSTENLTGMDANQIESWFNAMLLRAIRNVELT